MHAGISLSGTLRDTAFGHNPLPIPRPARYHHAATGATHGHRNRTPDLHGLRPARRAPGQRAHPLEPQQALARPRRPPRAAGALIEARARARTRAPRTTVHHVGSVRLDIPIGRLGDARRRSAALFLGPPLGPLPRPATVPPLLVRHDRRDPGPVRVAHLPR